MSEVRSYKKPLLYSLVISVVLAAMLSIFLVLRNTWGWFEIRVLISTVVIAASSLCGLACDLAKLPSGRNVLPRCGLALTAASAALLMFGIWSETNSEEFWKLTTTVCIFGVATVHVCLLSIARLVGRFRWATMAGYQLVYGLAATLAFVMIGEVDSEGMWRFIAALAIIVAAISLVIPILHRISRLEQNQRELLSPTEQNNIASIDREIRRLRDQISKLETVRASLTGQKGPA